MWHHSLNDPPEIHLPDDPVEFEENSILTFAAADGTGITVTDAEERNLSGKLTVELRVNTGKLTLASTNGLTFTIGDGTEDGHVAFFGIPAAVNGALSGMMYEPPTDYVGSDQLFIKVTDNGDPKSDSPPDSTETILGLNVLEGIIVLTIEGTTNTLQTTDDGTVEPFAGLSVDARNASTLPLTITLTLDNNDKGGFTEASMTEAGVSFAKDAYLFIGTAAQASEKLPKLVLQPTENRVAAGDSESVGITITAAVEDAFTEDNLTIIKVFSVNDDTLVTNIPTLLEISDDVPAKIFSGATVSDPDAGNRVTFEFNFNNALELGVWAIPVPLSRRPTAT